MLHYCSLTIKGGNLQHERYLCPFQEALKLVHHLHGLWSQGLP